MFLSELHTVHEPRSRRRQSALPIRGEGRQAARTDARGYGRQGRFMESLARRTNLHRLRLCSWMAPFLGAGTLWAAAEPDRLLLNPQADSPLPPITTQDARIDPVSRGTARSLRVTTGQTAEWPGITLKAPEPPWDLSPFARVVLEVRNLDTNELKLFGRVDNPGADGNNHCVTDSVVLAPGSGGLLQVELKRSSGDTLDGRLFGLRGYPVRTGGKGTLDPAQVNQMLVFVHRPARPHTFELKSVRATGAFTPPTASVTDADPYLPLIDTFGQYRHKPWPDKVRSVDDLRRRRQEEQQALARNPSPEGWTRYGAWQAGPTLEATGFFRVQKHAGKWWLVDPEGRLFWSHGIDCVRMLDATAIEEREAWFDDPPWRDPALQEFLVAQASALKGHYAGRSPRSYSFAGANLKRKYGDDWRSVQPPILHQRLRSWGFNTIGMWSDHGVCQLRRTAYVDAVGSHGARLIEGSEGYWGKFPDPFAPSFREVLQRSMNAKRGTSAGDPWCLGFFCDNELAWGDETSLAEAALKSPADQPAKQHFLADLRQHYATLEALNASWGTDHASWDALAAHRAAPDPARARNDLTAFYSRIADRYFQTVRDIIKEGTPHQLFLGCRFAWANRLATASAARFCDVVSFNLYQRSVADFAFNGDADVPLIIGEFHFGALDRGLFHTGLVPVASQDERATAYAGYVEGALRHPQFVGCHWFQYQDEPTTGRVYDEENYQIGMVDIADTPYAETMAASRRVANSMYRIRTAP